MFGLAFSKMATSSSHSLCCTGCCAAGGAQSMLIVTLPPDPPALALPLLEAELLEQAAAARTRPATATAAATGRWRSRWYMLLIAPSLPWAERGDGPARRSPHTLAKSAAAWRAPSPLG